MKKIDEIISALHCRVDVDMPCDENCSYLNGNDCDYYRLLADAARELELLRECVLPKGYVPAVEDPAKGWE